MDQSVVEVGGAALEGGLALWGWWVDKENWAGLWQGAHAWQPSCPYLTCMLHPASDEPTLRLLHTHTRTHTFIHAHTHTRAHTRTHAHKHSTCAADGGAAALFRGGRAERHPHAGQDAGGAAVHGVRCGCVYCGCCVDIHTQGKMLEEPLFTESGVFKKVCMCLKCLTKSGDGQGCVPTPAAGCGLGDQAGAVVLPRAHAARLAGAATLILLAPPLTPAPPLLLPSLAVNTHAHTHAHTHAYTHTYTRTHTHTRAHTHAHAHTHMHTRTHIHTHALPRAGVRVLALVPAHTAGRLREYSLRPLPPALTGELPSARDLLFDGEQVWGGGGRGPCTGVCT